MNIKMEGAKQLEKKLKTLGPKVARKVVRRAIRKGGKVQQGAIKQTATGMVGGRMGAKISRNIVVRAKKKNKKGTYGVKIMINPKASFAVTYTLGSSSSLETRRTSGNRYYIPNAIEYGHAFPGRGGSPGAPKDVAPVPFMRTGSDSSAAKTVAVVKKDMYEGIKALWSKK